MATPAETVAAAPRIRVDTPINPMMADTTAPTAAIPESRIPTSKTVKDIQSESPLLLAFPKS